MTERRAATSSTRLQTMPGAPGEVLRWVGEVMAYGHDYREQV